MADPIGLGISSNSTPKRPIRYSQTASPLHETVISDSGNLPASLPLIPNLGPHLQIHPSFAEQNAKHIVIALESGLRCEVAWALNSLALLTFSDKDNVRRETGPLSRIPGLLDALLRIVDEWRNGSSAFESTEKARERILGLNCVGSGFGLENGPLDPSDPLLRIRSLVQNSFDESSTKNHLDEEFWWIEEGIFNLDEEGRAQKQLWAVAASNVLRNLTFVPENEIPMASHKHCLHSLFQWIMDFEKEDEELVTNAAEMIVNLAAHIDLKTLAPLLLPDSNALVTLPNPISGEKALHSILALLYSPIRAWHCAASEAITRLAINPENESLLLSSIPKIYPKLLDLIVSGDYEVQSVVIGTLSACLDLGSSSKLRLSQERRYGPDQIRVPTIIFLFMNYPNKTNKTSLGTSSAVPRLLSVIRPPHPALEVSKKAALALESLATEPRAHEALLAYEGLLAEIAMSDSRLGDIFARILAELSFDFSVPSFHRSIWGA